MAVGEHTTVAAVALDDGELLVWDEESWSRMARERPLMHADIMKACMKQQDDDLNYGVPHAVATKDTLVDEEIQRTESGNALDDNNHVNNNKALMAISAGHLGLEDLAKGFDESCHAQDHKIPESLSQMIQGIKLAKVLGDIGLF